MLQRVDLVDRVAVAPARMLKVSGFHEDTIVRGALERLAAWATVEPQWAVRLTKRIPVAAGLGGGSSDAATAVCLANAMLPRPLSAQKLHELAAEVGADVPFFLRPGPQVGTGDGTELAPVDLPQDFWVLLVLQHGAAKPSTAAVYRRFDARGGDAGYEERRASLLSALAAVRGSGDLARLPGNDLATSPLAARLTELGAFRADVSGAGPAVYGLFRERAHARRVARALRGVGRTWVAAPCWYG